MLELHPLCRGDNHRDFLNAQALVHTLTWQPQQPLSVSGFQPPFLISSILVLAALFLFLRQIFHVSLLFPLLPSFPLIIVYVLFLSPLPTVYVFLLSPLLPSFIPLQVSDTSLLFLFQAQMQVAFLLPVQTLYPVE